MTEAAVSQTQGQASEDSRTKAPSAQEWATVLDVDESDLVTAGEAPRGQALQVTQEVTQDKTDSSVFKVDGKDRSWFMQKGGIMFDCRDKEHFRLTFSFLGGDVNRYGNDYADLSRVEQAAQENWLLMAGVAPRSYKLTGYKDCKLGFYFLFHLSYRRTCWRIICSPHNAELEDSQGQAYTCDPQDSNQFEIPASEGQEICIDYSEGKLSIVDHTGERLACGHWSHDGEGAAEGKLPKDEYRPVILTPNCPTQFRASVDKAKASI
mmetsp:Transcript_110501/g.174628  ORF Transcript_110501/g.174628 Transcript_110501/m.174628 type:complete len:265 (-) Transcript_110501:21-815(-)